jgi:hypothetical protein
MDWRWRNINEYGVLGNEVDCSGRLGILCSIHLSYGGTIIFQVVSTSPLPYQCVNVSKMSLQPGRTEVRVGR